MYGVASLVFRRALQVTRGKAWHGRVPSTTREELRGHGHLLGSAELVWIILGLDPTAQVASEQNRRLLKRSYYR